ncbi:hypothetical protein GCM10023175_22540 [Pseudonocardia xishanensis]|uniref:Uncharacterized protein n=1 Tax=Pseudonocardia xishanensis TaxID=630995 RepID=A0ABP8RQT7_9PSEU
MQWTSEELHREVRKPLESPAPTADDRRIDVTGMAPGPDDSLIIDVEVVPGAGTSVQRWRLSFRSMWADVRGLPLESAGLTVRANIEEWWDTGAEEGGPGHLVKARRTV